MYEESNCLQVQLLLTIKKLLASWEYQAASARKASSAATDKFLSSGVKNLKKSSLVVPSGNGRVEPGTCKEMVPASASYTVYKTSGSRWISSACGWCSTVMLSCYCDTMIKLCYPLLALLCALLCHLCRVLLPLPSAILHCHWPREGPPPSSQLAIKLDPLSSCKLGLGGIICIERWGNFKAILRSFRIHS